MQLKPIKMSNIINNGKFAAGSIYKIKLTNFMTYIDIDFFPGPSLNIILGPNGTGKSSLIYAIILGLGGTPADICQKSLISSYINQYCSEAKIEIELYRNKGETNMVVTTFLKPRNITWEIDYQAVTRNTLLKELDKYKIQVTNLCQVLPQLKLDNFSNQSPTTLLVNTLTAVSGLQGEQIRNDLMEMSQMLKDKQMEKKIMEKELSELKTLNKRDKLSVVNMEKKEKLEHDLEMCRLKQTWLEVAQLDEEIKQLESDIQQKYAPVQECKKRIERKEREMHDVHEKCQRMDTRKNKINNKMSEVKQDIENIQDNIRSVENKYRSIDAHLMKRQEETDERDKELNFMEVKLEKRKEDRNAFLKKYGDENFLQNKMDDLKQVIERKLSMKRKQQEQKETVQIKAHNITNRIKSYEKLLQSLTDQTQRRMELLKNKFNHTYQALEWFESNRNLFSHPVYKPMLLEITFTDERLARYLENTVSNRDLTAFTFCCADDMELFQREVRRRGLKRVNLLHVRAPAAAPPPPPLRADIQHLGFSKYVSETFNAPVAIMHYLCENYSVNLIPIGNAHTSANMDHVPSDITMYFTDKYRVRVKMSAYSNRSSKTITEFGSACLLGTNEKEREVQEMLSKSKAEEAEIIKEIEKFRNEEKRIQDEINPLQASKEELVNNINQLKGITLGIEDSKRKLLEIRNRTPNDMDAERARARQQQAEVARRLVARQPELTRAVTTLHAAVIYQAALQKRLRNLKIILNHHNENIKHLKKTCKEVEEIWRNANNEKEAKIFKREKKVEKIKQACQHKLPNSADFPYANDFRSLPSDHRGLLRKQDKINREMNSISLDRELVENYKERQRTIAKMKDAIQNMQAEIQTIQHDITNNKPMWISNVKNIIQSMSERFSIKASQLGFSGEVVLKTGADEGELEQYGVEVLVSSRRGECAARLCGGRQSGGERALVTACYVLALQAAARAPFKCLDEVNQGMDSSNENRLFQLLMQEVAGPDPCQYFLLSPNLLKNLEYSDKVKVHITMNGPYNITSKEWQVEKFLKKARLLKN